jgi:hypothetical protein
VPTLKYVPFTGPYDRTGDDEGVIFEEDEEADEGYLFAGQGTYAKYNRKMYLHSCLWKVLVTRLLNTTSDEEVDDDDELGDPQEEDSTSIPAVPDPYDGVYSNVPKEEYKLKPVHNCQHCNAKKFEFEPPGFCCRSGKIELSTPDTPPDLMRLWSSADADARHFRDNIRFFNGHFSFTSLYCYLDRSGIVVYTRSLHMARCTTIYNHLVDRRVHNLSI